MTAEKIIRDDEALPNQELLTELCSKKLVIWGKNIYVENETITW